MLWKFSFAAGSTLESLFMRELPPSVEEVMDEQDVLNECKAQNQRLVTFLGREDSIKSLLSWIQSGLDELDEQIASSGDSALAKALADPESFPSYHSPRLLAAVKGTSLDPAFTPEDQPSPPLEPAKMAEEAMRRAESERDFSSSYGSNGGLSGAGARAKAKDDEAETQRARYPLIAAEILTSELWVVPETIMLNKDTLLRPFWDAVVPPLPESAAVLDADASPEAIEARQRAQFLASEKERARAEFWSDEDEDRDRRREVIRGLWSKVIVSLVAKRSTEMIRFIQSLPDAVPRLCAHLSSPALQDILIRLVSAEENGVPGTVRWLSEQGLVPLLIAYLSPHHPSSTHIVVGELLKSIVTLCAPTPFNPHGGNLQEQQAGGAGGEAAAGRPARDNRLIRELVAEDNLAVLVGYMLDPLELTDEGWKGVNGDGTPHPADPYIAHPLPNIASAATSVGYIAAVFVEIIRRNNSDFAEPHLFHTLRNRLMNMRMAQGGASDAEGDEDKEQEGMARMEEAMKDISETMGIVHLGSMLRMLCERFDRLNGLLREPRSQMRASSAAIPRPLTEERFRVVELYAELLHSSNMAILNRVPGAGPTYSSHGILTGGLPGLEALGEAIELEGDGDGIAESVDGNAAGGEVGEGMTPARELPVSVSVSSATSASASASASWSGSLSDSDVDVADAELESEDERNVEDMDLDKEGDGAGEGEGEEEGEGDVTPSQSRRSSRIIGLDGDGPAPVPPPPSKEDAERLVEVRDAAPVAASTLAGAGAGAGTETGTDTDVGVASDAAQANTTAAPSVASTAELSERGRSDVDVDVGEGLGEGSESAAAVGPATSLSVPPGAGVGSAGTGPEADAAQSATTPDPASIPSGRLLKQAYKTHGVVTLVVDLFFEYGNNDFLHHVVYDFLQQVLNGRLGAGANRELVKEVLVGAGLVERVLEVVQRNEQVVSTGKPRLAVMGHIILISDELVKLLSRCPADLLGIISPRVPQPAWDEFVRGALQESKMRDAIPLAGGKPAPGAGGAGGAGATGTAAAPSAGGAGSGVRGVGGAGLGTGGADDSSDSSDDDEEDEDATERRLGSFGTFGEPLKRTRAAEGWTHRERDREDGDDDEDDRVRSYYWRSGTTDGQRHVDSSDEDDDDADWMKPGDDFGSYQNYNVGPHGDDSDDEDGWGTFSSASASHNENAGEGSGGSGSGSGAGSGGGSNPFGDDNFAPFDGDFTPSVQPVGGGEAKARRASAGSASVPAPGSDGPPLTPLDWFHREFDKAWGDESGAGAGSGDVGAATGAQAGEEDSDSSDEDEDEDDGAPSIVVPKQSRSGGAGAGPEGDAEGEGEGEGEVELDLELPSTPGSAWSFEGEEGDGVDLPAAFSPTVGRGEGEEVGEAREKMRGLGLDDVSDTTAAEPSTRTTSTLSKPIDIPVSPSRSAAARTGPSSPLSPARASPSSPLRSSGSGASGSSPSASPRRAPPPPPPSRRRAGSVTTAPAGGVPGLGLAASPARQAFSPRHTAGLSGSGSGSGSGSWAGLGGALGDAASSSPSPSGMAFSPPDAALRSAPTADEPLGPGVSRDTEVTGDGMLKREVGGEEVVVPKDEVVLGVEEMQQQRGA